MHNLIVKIMGGLIAQRVRTINLALRALLALGSSFLLLTPVTVCATDFLWAIPKPDSVMIQSEKIIEPKLRTAPKELSNTISSSIAISPYIVGGIPTYRGEYPEYSSLWVDGLDGYIYFICGGTLLSGNKILTAAHCTIDYSASRFYVIPNFYSHDDTITSSDLYQASNKVIHSSYTTNPPNNDISILYLSRSANTARVKIYGGSNQFVNYISTVVGMGSLYANGPSPTLLQKVDLPVVSNTTCSNYWGSSYITASMLCAGNPSVNKSACTGDSGGPLFLNYQGQRVQAGIVSWGSTTCTGYNVYSRISSLIGFIRAYAPEATIVGNVGWLPAIYYLLL